MPAFAVERTVDSTGTLVATSNIKQHTRVATTADDTYLAGLVAAAQKEAERFTRSGFLTQTWRDTRDDFPSGDVWPLQRGPVINSSNVSVQYRPSSGGGAVTFGSTNYIVDDRSLFGRVVLKSEQAWPSEDLQDAIGAEVSWEVGYGDKSSDVPEDLKHAVKLMVASNYEHREDVVVGSQAVKLPRAAESLLRGYRVPEVPGAHEIDRGTG